MLRRAEDLAPRDRFRVLRSVKEVAYVTCPEEGALRGRVLIETTDGDLIASGPDDLYYLIGD